MFDLNPEEGRSKPKIKPLFVVVSALIMLISYYFIIQTNKNETEVFIETSEPISDIYVDISGAVNLPGVYKLNSDNRVADVLRLAEGISSKAHYEWVSKNLNMSHKLQDGQKIYIPFEWDIDENMAMIVPLFGEEKFNVGVSGVTNPSNLSTENPQEQSAESTTGSLINVNTASLDQLMGLNGIGQVYGQKIIDNRPYSGLSEFSANSGLSENLVSKISEYISF